MHWQQGWPRHYATINEMPYEVAVVFTRMLYTSQSEEEQTDILGELMGTLKNVRENFG